MEILHEFGVEGKLLVVQLVNFAIFALVFWKLILPRLTKLLDERKAQISESLAAAEQAKAEVEQAQAAREKELEAARAEADRVIAEATEQAQAEAAELLAQARQDADRMRQQQTEQLQAEQAKLRAELREEVAGLAIATTRKVLGDVITKADSAKMVAAAERKLRASAKPKGKARR